MLNNHTPGRAIRKVCTDCVDTTFAVKDCQGDKLYDDPCLFYRFRLGKGHPSVKLIRKYCLWCLGGSARLVKECLSQTCPLHPYRLGRNPKKGAGRRDFFTRIDERGVGNGLAREEQI